MANILYGINGEGSGHSTRSKEVINHLQKSGHKVIIVTSGRAAENFKGIFKVENIFGFRFEYVKGRVDTLASVLKNLNAFPGVARSLKKISDLFKKEKIDLVITDFEPVSSVAANIKRLPTISIDNQHFITNSDAGYPSKYAIQGDLTKAGIEVMTFGAEAYLTLSFFDAKPKNEKTFIVPPIIRSDVLKLKPTIKDYVIVYSTHGLDKIVSVLKPVKCKFVLYGADQESTDGNLIFKKFNQPNFLKDLAGAKGVLATSGFSLISEALYLRKPYFAWPASNQFEQTFNAYHLERLGYGVFKEELASEDVEFFLANLAKFRKNLATYPYKGNAVLFKKLEELIKNFTSK